MLLCCYLPYLELWNSVSVYESDGSHQLLDVMTREHYDIKSMDLVRFIYETCGWDKKYTYRINGIAMPDHRMIVFDLTTALKVDEFR